MKKDNNNINSQPNNKNTIKLTEVEKPISLKWPNSFYKQCVYLIMAPIMFALYYTMPDVKKQVVF